MTLIRMWRRADACGGACCVGVRARRCGASDAENGGAFRERTSAARFDFCAGATTGALVRAALPAQQSAQGMPASLKDSTRAASLVSASRLCAASPCESACAGRARQQS